MAKHAYLSASASERWLKCFPSAKLCAQEENRGSPCAQQGTDAHELCKYLVENNIFLHSISISNKLPYE